jgi:hypothetical protein
VGEAEEGVCLISFPLAFNPRLDLLQVERRQHGGEILCNGTMDADRGLSGVESHRSKRRRIEPHRSGVPGGGNQVIRRRLRGSAGPKGLDRRPPFSTYRKGKAPKGFNTPPNVGIPPQLLFVSPPPGGSAVGHAGHVDRSRGICWRHQRAGHGKTVVAAK